MNLFSSKNNNRYKYNGKLVIFSENGLGDYFLFRQFLPYLKKSQKYSLYKIIFLAQDDRITLSKKYDKEYIDEWILLNKNNLKQIIKKLNSEKITDLINLTVLNIKEEPEGPLSQILFKKVRSKNKYCHVFGMTEFKKKKNYTMICTPNDKIFETERNRIFFSKLINSDINISDNYSKINPPFCLKGKFIGIVPFAGKLFKFKQWNITNYISLCKKINIAFPEYKIILIGSDVNETDINNIITNLNFDVINSINKVDSMELPSLISSLEYLITPESGLVHLVAAIDNGPKCLVLSNGAFYKRFHPYILDRIHYVYPDIVENKLKYVSNQIEDILYGFKKVTNNINDIYIDKVFLALTKLMKEEPNEQNF